MVIAPHVNFSLLPSFFCLFQIKQKSNASLPLQKSCRDHNVDIKIYGNYGDRFFERCHCFLSQPHPLLLLTSVSNTELLYISHSVFYLLFFQHPCTIFFISLSLFCLLLSSSFYSCIISMCSCQNEYRDT